MPTPDEVMAGHVIVRMSMVMTDVIEDGRTPRMMYEAIRNGQMRVTVFGRGFDLPDDCTAEQLGAAKQEMYAEVAEFLSLFNPTIIVHASDLWIRTYETREELEEMVTIPGNRDVRSSEALAISIFRKNAPARGMVRGYSRGDDGKITWGKLRPVARPVGDHIDSITAAFEEPKNRRNRGDAVKDMVAAGYMLFYEGRTLHPPIEE